MLIVTAFLSYMGSLTRKYRSDLMYENWLPFLESLEVKIPRTTELDVLALLTDDAQIAQWNNEGEYIYTFYSLVNVKIYYHLNVMLWNRYIIPRLTETP